MPCAEQRFDSLRQLVFEHVARDIGDQFDTLRIGVPDHVFEKVADRVHLEIAGHDADAQRPPLVGRLVDEPARPRFRKPRDQFAVGHRIGEIRLRRRRIHVVEREQQIAPRLGQVRRQGDRVPIGLDRRIGLVEFQEHIGEIVVCLRVIGLLGDYRAEDVECLVEFLERAQCIAQIVVCIHVVGLQRDSLAKALRSRRVTVVRRHHSAEIEVVERLRAALERGHDEIDGVVEISRVVRNEP